jgi:death on curing protein
MRKKWKWMTLAVALAAHEEQIAEHGGEQGTRDATLLESAMARPENLAAYGDPDAAYLAAAYGFGIARNHPFVDGNKRTAAVVCEAFLGINGFHLDVDDFEYTTHFEELAAGYITEVDFAIWLRAHLVVTNP